MGPASRRGGTLPAFGVQGRGGGPGWPGGTQYLPVLFIGPMARDFSATDAIWNFFARHPRP